MPLNRISAAEAASLIKHGYNIGLSGFTPAGTAKAVTAELAKIAEAEHAKGNPFQVGIFTGASTGGALRIHGQSERCHHRSLRGDSGRKNLPDCRRRYRPNHLPPGRPDYYRAEQCAQ